VLPVTVVMFVLSRRFGALASRFGPRLFMGAGPLVSAAGLLLMQTIDVRIHYLADVLPGLLLFALGLSMTVAPLTTAVLAGSEHEAGIASGVNNAIARVAGLLGTAAVGAAVAGSFASTLDSHLHGVALGSAAGPIVSGVMLSFASWQWLFAINIPVGLAIYVLALKAIPKTPGHRGAFDLTSALMSVAMFGLAVFGVDAFGHDGATPLAAGEVLAAAIVGWIFIRRQRATPLPMFAVDLFAQMRFTLAAFACFASFIAQTIAYVALPFAFQTVMGHTPLQVGALLLPWLLAAAYDP